MAHAFKLSDFGLKLIKAYEGFRPAETTLVSGQRVIGYGHRYLPDEEPLISRKKAESILMGDLEPYEDMVNESIFAPLSQSQFDALVSLSFNIGPRAFLSSNVIHCLNNGRPLEAAAGFDEWRKSVINGKTYVVDALVRRRTAEKALFLRPVEGVVAAPRNEIPPSSDINYTRIDSETPTYGRYTEDGVVARAPYEARQDESNETPASASAYRRREDGPAGTLTLSEIVRDDPVEQDSQIPDAIPPNDEGLSPIAIAAAEVSERLEALIADRPETSGIDLETDRVDVDALDPTINPNIEIVAKPAPVINQNLAANDGAHEDYRRPGRDRQPAIRTPDIYITKTKVDEDALEASGSGGFWTALILGTFLAAGGAYKWFFDTQGGLDPLNAFLAPVATIVGAMIVLGAIYYLIKSMFVDGDQEI
jgi:GH24 family phage-related lysozyme (muramidase)